MDMNHTTAIIKAPYFWQAVQLYLKKAHVVNRRLSAVVPLGYAKVCLEHDSPVPILQVSELISDNLKNALDKGELHIFKKRLQLNHPKSGSFLGMDLHLAATQQDSRFLVIVNKLLAKNTSVFVGCHEIVVIGKT